MIAERTDYYIYGVHLAPGTDYRPLEDDPGYCMNNETVGLFLAGPLDNRRVYLALRWTKVDLGEHVFHSGTMPVAPMHERDRWNSDLDAVVDQFGLGVAEGPGWFTIPSEV